MIKLLKNTLFENAKGLNAHFEKHYHDTYTIGITYDGLLKLNKANNTSNYLKYSCRINNPGEIHCGVSKKWSHINFYPKVELLSKIYEEIFFEKKIPLFKEHIINDHILFIKLHNFFLSIYQDKDELQSESLLIEALSYLILNYTSCTKSKIEFGGGKKMIKNSIEYIKSNIDKNITLDELSAVSNLSKYHFLRIFKKELGITPHHFIINEKINYANSLIQKGISLSEASFSAGFSDQSHFTRNFKKFYGQTLKKGNFILY